MDDDLFTSGKEERRSERSETWMLGGRKSCEDGNLIDEDDDFIEEGEYVENGDYMEEDDRKRKRRRGRNTSTFLPSFVPTMSSVKVAVRVRPFNSREVQRNCKLAIEMRNTQTIISGGPKARRSFSLFLFHLSLLPPLSFPRSPHMILSDCLTYQMPSYFFYFLFN